MGNRLVGSGDQTVWKEIPLDNPCNALTEFELDQLRWIVMDENLHQPVMIDAQPFPDILGYKAVNFAFANNIISPVSAVLWLQIPYRRDNGVAKSEANVTVAPPQLYPNIKYRTGRALVRGVQFVGNPKDVARVILAFQQGVGWLESIHSSRFKYPLSEWVNEPAFYKSSTNAEAPNYGCGSGIHFFTNIAGAIGYKSQQANEWPMITKVFHQRKTVAASSAMDIDSDSDSAVSHLCIEATREFLDKHKLVVPEKPGSDTLIAAVSQPADPKALPDVNKINLAVRAAICQQVVKPYHPISVTLDQGTQTDLIVAE